MKQAAKQQEAEQQLPEQFEQQLPGQRLPAVEAEHAATAQLPPPAPDSSASASAAASASSNLAEKYYRNQETQDGYFPMAVAETAKGAFVKDLKHYFQCYFPHGKFPREEASGNAQLLWSGVPIGLSPILGLRAPGPDPNPSPSPILYSNT